jgi:hypothetical protein
LILQDGWEKRRGFIKRSRNWYMRVQGMLMATVKDALEILGYGSSERIESEIFDLVHKQR